MFIGKWPKDGGAVPFFVRQRPYTRDAEEISSQNNILFIPGTGWFITMDTYLYKDRNWKPRQALINYKFEVSLYSGRIRRNPSIDSIEWFFHSDEILHSQSEERPDISRVKLSNCQPSDKYFLFRIRNNDPSERLLRLIFDSNHKEHLFCFLGSDGKYKVIKIPFDGNYTDEVISQISPDGLTALFITRHEFAVMDNPLL